MTVRVLPDSTFEGCERLEVAFLPEGVSELGKCSYRGCKSLFVFELPPLLLQFGDGAFEECQLMRASVFKARVVPDRTFMHFELWVGLWLRSFVRGDRRRRVHWVHRARR
jgi:hypothetical protein